MRKNLSTSTTSDGLIAAMRLTGERIAEPTAGGLYILSVEVVSRSGQNIQRARVTFESLNHALMLSRQLVEVESTRELAGLLRTVAPTSRRRSRLARRLSASGGVALVDELVEAAVRHAGYSVGSVIATLRGGRDGVVTLTRAGAPAVKAWLEEGRLVCSFELDPLLRWNSARLVVRLQLSAVLQATIAGRSVSTIADHPMLPGRIRIVSCHPTGGENEITLKALTRVVTERELGG